jgi:AcrR family transcriptional regulator
MPIKKAKPSTDINTEAKIKAAARVVFHKKGFAAARTRDIAEESGINLALLNYYFRSKEKLFHIIMLETISEFLQNIALVFNDEKSTLEQKLNLMAEKYIDQLTHEPEIPVFLMNEIRSHGAELFEKLPFARIILHSTFIKQYEAAVKAGKVTTPNPLHFIMNLMGMIVFPFIGSPLIKKVGGLSDSQFDKLMQERKKMIPIWVKAMLKAK